MGLICFAAKKHKSNQRYLRLTSRQWLMRSGRWPQAHVSNTVLGRRRRTMSICTLHWRENIDVVGWSQLAAYPSIPSMGLQARDPSVAMLNYTTGEGNARYHALKMMIQYTSAGDALLETMLSDSKDIYAQGFTSKKDSSALTIVLGNKSVKEQQVALHVDPKGKELTGCTTHTVDGLTGDGPPRQGSWDGRSPFALGPFAISVVRCKASM